MDWYVHKPEQYIDGEVMCACCGGLSDQKLFVHVRAKGLYCFACLNNGVDDGSIMEDMYDMTA